MLQFSNSSTASARGDLVEQPEPFAWLPGALAFLRRSRVIVAATVAACLGLAVFYLIIATPKFDAAAEILIDLRQAELFRQQNTATDSQVLNSIVESQVEILRSSTTALAAIERLGPSVYRELSEKGFIQSLLGPIVDQFRSSGAPAQTQEEVKLAAAEKLLSQVQIKRVGITNIIQISARTPSAVRSARYANAIADSFLTGLLEAKYETTRRGRSWLETRLAELRDQATAADRAVQDYKVKTNIVDTDKGLMSERQVGDLNTAVGVAQAKTAEAKARYERIKEIIDKNIVDGSVIESTQNQVIVRLRQQYFDTKKREADISAKYGSNHVAAANARAEMAEIQRSLQSELRQVAEGYASEYEVALTGEQAIKKRLDELVADAGLNNRSRVELRSLESSSQTYRALYENFLQRYTQAVQDQSFPISEARIVEPAYPPLRKAWPKGLVILGLALLLGIGGGIVIAFLRDLLRNSVRTAADIEKATGIPCVATIPSVRTFRSGRTVLPRLLDEFGLRPRETSRDLLLEAVVHPLSETAEAMQEIKLLLERAPNRNGGCRVIGMVSAISGEGKTTVASNLAHYLAMSGKRVILLDYDLRYPSLSRTLAPDAEVGLIESVRNGSAPALVTLKARGASLFLLPSVIGERAEHSTEILRSPNNKALLDSMKMNADVIVIDYPPMLDFLDVRATDELVDHYFMVVGSNRSNSRQLAECISRDRFDATRVLGAILNRADANRNFAKRSNFGRYFPWNQGAGARYNVHTPQSL
ncbi:UNVERIFIED_ORG: succinoglycan biosynthesis transport protein ExoP [Methylobacterium sp. SuP10 SLI 274]|uniref:AAA family ATPase n=1 Tax=Methylorubrum extorquens TaxID=408 RepID=UPI001AE272C9|nr:AAA family ATPase [Methylorubrum extorquens]MDF9861311.1 succinoglycan biosynthesis transport protein ExoP [Methylorubrum pseudosasae]MDH6634938.1 succinoglycan biosynthesis transport protein ExoP [Methylobacterium sp. SuP10 SLI 274]MDH6664108.1 succinoglycan biosynthesis transport protein ExoP [Methylorubrum zatmanii]MCP1561114.1 succinoglycan biosynthesis transport protein ExoP [Methylorubrum extorquens]MDF9789594.1 succinoglycan biosynthesis transport protein ExoP [Methylorubrum extorque